MLCPKCGNMMKEGTFNSSRQIVWIGKGQDNDRVKLPGFNSFLWSEVPAWRCPECQVIFLPCADNNRGEK